MELKIMDGVRALFLAGAPIAGSAMAALAADSVNQVDGVQYGGFCAFAVANGAKADLDPRAHAVKDGKL